MAEPRVRARVMISGKVQGVYFRGSAEEEARSRGLAGWVRNTRDGQVEAVFEGERAAVEAMLATPVDKDAAAAQLQPMKEIFEKSVVAAVDIALHDIRGKALEQSIADMYGGRVREKMRHWENALFLGEGFPGAQPPELTPLQLPYSAEDRWLALEFPAKYKIDSDRLLYNAHLPPTFNSAQPISGLLVDEWTEVVPGLEETTGVAFHFDRPNTEPPQAWLLALPTTMTGTWSWDDLLGAVLDTLDSAKMRALEPVHIDSTAYSAFLPATVSAYTFPEISISNNLLRNVEIYVRLARG